LNSLSLIWSDGHGRTLPFSRSGGLLRPAVMVQLDPGKVDAGLPQVASVFANSIDGFSKRDQERTPVSDLAERDELFDVALERLALSPVNLYPERLDFDDSEISIHLAGNMDQEIRFRIVEDSSTDDGVPAFVNLACE
jgi:hypothetical protein